MNSVPYAKRRLLDSSSLNSDYLSLSIEPEFAVNFSKKSLNCSTKDKHKLSEQVRKANKQFIFLRKIKHDNSTPESHGCCSNSNTSIFLDKNKISLDNFIEELKNLIPVWKKQYAKHNKIASLMIPGLALGLMSYFLIGGSIGFVHDKNDDGIAGMIMAVMVALIGWCGHKMAKAIIQKQQKKEARILENLQTILEFFNDSENREILELMFTRFNAQFDPEDSQTHQMPLTGVLDLYDITIEEKAQDDSLNLDDGRDLDDSLLSERKAQGVFDYGDPKMICESSADDRLTPDTSIVALSNISNVFWRGDTREPTDLFRTGMSLKPEAMSAFNPRRHNADLQQDMFDTISGVSASKSIEAAMGFPIHFPVAVGIPTCCTSIDVERQTYVYAIIPQEQKPEPIHWKSLKSFTDVNVCASREEEREHNFAEPVGASDIAFAIRVKLKMGYGNFAGNSMFIPIAYQVLDVYQNRHFHQSELNGSAQQAKALLLALQQKSTQEDLPYLVHMHNDIYLGYLMRKLAATKFLNARAELISEEQEQIDLLGPKLSEAYDKHCQETLEVYKNSQTAIKTGVGAFRLKDALQVITKMLFAIAKEKQPNYLKIQQLESLSKALSASLMNHNEASQQALQEVCQIIASQPQEEKLSATSDSEPSCLSASLMRVVGLFKLIGCKPSYSSPAEIAKDLLVYQPTN